TRTDGTFEIGVFGGQWHLQLNGGETQQRGWIGPDLSFNVTDGNDITNIRLQALQSNERITGLVKNANNEPVAGIFVFGSANLNGAVYLAGGTFTDASGNFALQVATGTWSVGLSCFDLERFGYECVSNQSAPSGGNVQFTVRAASGLQILTSTLPDAVAGQSYATQLIASGGEMPYTWSLAPDSNPLPGGLGLSSAGGIQGTPTVTGDFTIRVRVIDNRAVQAEKTLTLKVQSGGNSMVTLLSNHSLLTDPGALVAFGNTLFVANGNSILGMPLEGGEPMLVQANVSPCCIQGLTILNDHLYWIDPNGDPDATAIFKRPVLGGGITKIYSGFATGQPIVDGSDLTSDSTRLFSVDFVGGRVHRLNADGSGITALGPARYSGGFVTEHLNTITFFGGRLYVADSGRTGTIDPQVVSIGDGGGEFQMLHSGPPFVSPSGIAANEQWIFVADSGANNTIWKLPIQGGAPTPLVSGSPFVHVNRLMLFNNALYISDDGNVGGANGPGAIFKVSLGATGPDVELFGVGKQREYVQTSDATLDLHAGTPFAFQAFASETEDGQINAAWVLLP
ncbi:MAG: putative Ig domain-containing protein, partial [Verrucomicrobiota bacterium]